MASVTKEKIIESIRDGAIVTDPSTLLGHMCVLIICLSEDLHSGKNERAYAEMIDACEIATECVEMWLRTFAGHNLHEIVAKMSEIGGDQDMDKLIDHISTVKTIAKRGRAILDAKKVPN